MNARHRLSPLRIRLAGFLSWQRRPQTAQRVMAEAKGTTRIFLLRLGRYFVRGVRTGALKG
jgi:hypothetical protein